MILAAHLRELEAEAIRLRATKVEVQQLADQTINKFTELTIELDTAKEAIALKASQTEVDNLKNVVSNMSAELTVQAGLIATKVEKDGVISAINQSAESIEISASRINLDGYVTMSDLESTNARITNLINGHTTMVSMVATSGNITSLTVGSSFSALGHGVYWQGVTIGGVNYHLLGYVG